MADGPRIGLKDLPLDLSSLRGPLANGPMDLKPLQSAKGKHEANYLKRLLESTKGSIALSARVAGISRQNLYEKLHRHGISRDSFRQQ
jgi:transcriptional regulator of acetoin/glycerol metabolism